MIETIAIIVLITLLLVVGAICVIQSERIHQLEGYIKRNDDRFWDKLRAKHE